MSSHPAAIPEILNEKPDAVALSGLKGFCFVLLIGCLFSDLYMSYFDIGPYALRNYLAVIAFIILIWKFITERHSISNLKIPVALKCLLALWCVFVLTSRLDFAANLRFFLKRLFMPGIIFTFTYFILKDKPLFQQKFIVFLVALVSVSSFVAIMQWFDMDIFWKIRDVMPIEENSKMIPILKSRHRAFGMAYYFIILGYQISLAFPLAMYVYDKTKNILFLLCAAILFIGAFATDTKSAVIAVCISLLILHRSKKRALLLIVLTFAAVYVKQNFSDIKDYLARTAPQTQTNNSQRTGTSQITKLSRSFLNITSSTAYARPLMLYNGVAFLARSPFGNCKWDAYHEFTNNQNAWLFKLKGGSALKRHAPHNEFLNTGILFGWPGLVILIYMYYRLFRDVSRKRSDPNTNALLPKAVITAIIAYMANSFFHNNGPFMGHPLPWYFYGLVYAVLESNQQPKTLESNLAQ